MLGKARKGQPRNRPAPERSRTAYSYYAGHTAPKAEKSIDLGTRSSRLRMLPSIIATLVIVGSILFSLTLSTSSAVQFVDDTADSPYRPTAEYEAKVAELVGKGLQNRTKFTIDTNGIENDIQEAFPEVAAAQLRLPVLGRKPTLLLDIREPSFVLAASSRSLVLDSSGTAVAEMRQLPADRRQGLLVLQDQSGITVDVGQQAVTSETIRFITAFKAQLDAQNLVITQLILPTVANELDIRIEGLSYYVKTDTSGDVRLQAGSFLATKAHLAEQGIVPSEYIDVRVEERAFYR